MERTVPSSLLFLFAAPLLAASGGPDQYGYHWKDSDEPDGPVYDWVDITTTGIELFGFGDDNTVGPYILEGDAPFYWYSEKLLWVGSNGYLAFNAGNIAADFPSIPQAGGTNNYIAGFMTDLTFLGEDNPARCFIDDDFTRTIVSYIDVPFWTVSAPGYTGSNTFQFILDKTDSTITVQYQSTTGFSSSNGPFIGIESLTGDIGLQRTSSLYPAAGYAVRFYNPADPLLDVRDASVTWAGADGTRGITLPVNGTLPLAAVVRNTGNQNLDGFSATSRVLNAAGQTLVTETLDVPALYAGQSYQLPLTTSFVPSGPGTYRHVVSVTGITDEFVSANNTLTREVDAYDVTQNVMTVDWAANGDDGIGIGWNGGNGGVGAYILPPFHPCQVTGTTIRIASNFGNAAFTLKVYDDDGPDGAPGTLLDSVMVPAVDGQAGDHVYPTTAPLLVTSGGLYVEWYMMAPDVNIAQDVQEPFSLQSYEVLQGVWAAYRDRDIADFHLGLRVEQTPFHDAGCSGVVGISPGQTVSQPTTVTTLIRNYGNLALTNVPVNYRFASGPITSQTYTGPAIIPGASALFSFTQQLQPAATVTGDLCVWTSLADDEHDENDSTCFSIDVVAGLEDLQRVDITLAPNPVRDELRIAGLPAGRLEVEVFDARGARVPVERLGTAPGTLRLDTQALPDGPYLLRVRTSDRLATARFVVQH